MNLGDVAFALFLPFVFALHWLLPRRALLQNAVLLLASVAFYSTWNLKLLPLLAVPIVIDWWIGTALRSSRPKRERKILLGLGITVDLGILALFKYAGFFATSLNALLATLGLDTSIPVLQLVLLLGISYTTLNRVGYLLDVYYERIAPERSLLRFAVFVGFFAHIIAGPIVRGSRMLPQYAVARRLRPQMLADGAAALLLGFVLKAYVAEWFGRSYVTPVFADHASFSALGHWLGLFGYGVQLFGDFAGYSLMAIGTGRLLGLELPENFRYPYLASGMMDFWRRWHISLNMWLFDYIFGPMTTSQGWTRGRISVGFLVVFLVSGLWHGPQWTFVIWGLMHGVALAVQHRWDLFYKSLCRQDRIWVKRRKSRAYTLAGWAITQFFFLLTLLPFRAPSMSFARDYFAGMFGGAGDQMPNLISLNLILCAGFLVCYHALELPPLRPVRTWLQALPAPVRGVAYGLAIVLLALFVPVGAGTFIYANF